MDRNNTIDKNPVQGTFLSAAEYVRMSTDHQQYSTQNQADKIREYAERHGIEIVSTYADEGRSGLNIDGRDALQRLIKDVQSGDINFQIILVYDVSRWGRFQDPDEAAYYEHLCRRKGILVKYVASPSTMTALQSRPSSRASSVPWPASTAGSFRPRCSPVNAG